MKIIKNIKWDIDEAELYEIAEEKTCAQMSAILNILETRYANMTTSEREDYIYEAYRHNSMDIETLLGVPSEIEVPLEIEDDEDAINDWLSDTYGYCYSYFDLEERMREFFSKQEALEYINANLTKRQYEIAMVEGEKTFMCATSIPLERLLRYPIETLVADVLDVMGVDDKETRDNTIFDIGAEVSGIIENKIREYAHIDFLCAYQNW